jgi:osmoprotectant transport system ATP-binding protein
MRWPPANNVLGVRVIEFDSVTKVFPGGTVAVDALTLKAPTGKITVLVGPSGCGKTTSLRMVNRMIEPSDGRILIDGALNTAIRKSQLRRGIGYVIQQAGLFPHRTVVDNIATVPLLLGWKKARARDRAYELLARVGLPETIGDRYPAQLSGGQQQRVGVARALAADPPIMLMDEPFSAVDPVVRAQLQDEFLRLQGELGKTIVFVTHDIDEAIKLGDHIAVLREGGKLAQFAPPQQLLADPADEFVANFVGRDRGFRSLSFLPAAELPLKPVGSVLVGATAARARAVADHAGGRWVLGLDEDGKPLGWLDVETMLSGDEVNAADLQPLGGAFRREDSLRTALDAAVLAASGLAVCVDGSGEVLGSVSHADIARYLARRQPVGEAA